MSQQGPPADAKQAQAAALAELEAAQRRKRAADTQLANLEEAIWRFEGSYLDETAASGGNIIKGFDNYLKPPGSNVNKKKQETTEDNRLFSKSSATFQASLEANQQQHDRSLSDSDFSDSPAESEYQDPQPASIRGKTAVATKKAAPRSKKATKKGAAPRKVAPAEPASSASTPNLVSPSEYLPGPPRQRVARRKRIVAVPQTLADEGPAKPSRHRALIPHRDDANAPGSSNITPAGGLDTTVGPATSVVHSLAPTANPAAPQVVRTEGLKITLRVPSVSANTVQSAPATMRGGFANDSSSSTTQPQPALALLAKSNPPGNAQRAASTGLPMAPPGTVAPSSIFKSAPTRRGRLASGTSTESGTSMAGSRRALGVHAGEDTRRAQRQLPPHFDPNFIYDLPTRRPSLSSRGSNKSTPSAAPSPRPSNQIVIGAAGPSNQASADTDTAAASPGLRRSKLQHIPVSIRGEAAPEGNIVRPVAGMSTRSRKSSSIRSRQASGRQLHDNKEN